MVDTLHKQLRRNPFKNQDGKIVLMQFPNWQLWGVVVVNLAQRIVSAGSISDSLSAAHVMFITFWAYEELTDGDNLFRRCLGLFVLITTAMAL
jgi:hypothetical protein